MVHEKADIHPWAENFDVPVDIGYYYKYQADKVLRPDAYRENENTVSFDQQLQTQSATEASPQETASTSRPFVAAENNNTKAFFRASFLNYLNYEMFNNKYDLKNAAGRNQMIYDLFASGSILDQDMKPYSLKNFDRAAIDCMNQKNVYIATTVENSSASDKRLDIYKVSMPYNTEDRNALQTQYEAFQNKRNKYNFDDMQGFYVSETAFARDPNMPQNEVLDYHNKIEDFCKNQLLETIKSLSDTDTALFKNFDINGHDAYRKLVSSAHDYLRLLNAEKKNLQGDQLKQYLFKNSKTLASRMEHWKESDNLKPEDRDIENIRENLLKDLKNKASEYEKYVDKLETPENQVDPLSRRGKRRTLAKRLQSSVNDFIKNRDKIKELTQNDPRLENIVQNKQNVKNQVQKAQGGMALH